MNLMILIIFFWGQLQARTLFYDTQGHQIPSAPLKKTQPNPKYQQLTADIVNLAELLTSG